jgi:TolB-like protein
VVIAHNSSSVFRGQGVDLREIGTQLSVTYIVQGSVRRAGDRIRVTAQLWAARYEGCRNDATRAFVIAESQ